MQAVKLLHVDKVRGGNSRIWFVCGQRVFDLMEIGLARDRELGGLLSSGPIDFVARVKKIKGQVKEFMKANKQLNKEMLALKHLSLSDKSDTK